MTFKPRRPKLDGEIVGLSVPDEDVEGWKKSLKNKNPVSFKKRESQEFLANLNDAEADKLYEEELNKVNSFAPMFEGVFLIPRQKKIGRKITGKERWQLFEHERLMLAKKFRDKKDEKN